MANLPDSPSSPATSAAIPTTTDRAYELMKQGEGRESRHEYEMVGVPPAASSPASKPLEEMYEIPSQPLPVGREQPLPAIPAEDGVYDSIPGDQ